MRLGTNEIPEKMSLPGATVRQAPAFGVAGSTLAAEHMTLAAGTDISPLLQGLAGGLCQAPHWGYVIGGELVVTYADGSSERCRQGDVFHWPSGHTVRVERDAQLVIFSPSMEHTAVLDHMAAMAAAG